MRTRGFALTALAALALIAAGCGEKPNVTVYRQGTYQGKPDNQPWQSQPFANNKTEWEKAIRARNNSQNEYVRIENQ
jgi:predicted outer membrane protein